ncbi:hypothetical protein V6N13_012873 [Hibiscus sabdariffa]
MILLPSNITVFTLDYSGSGLSGGEYVTLGLYEKYDLKAVVDYLRADGNVSLIGLWGRSMGAVTSLMYGAEDPSIAGMVLDSPFSDLVKFAIQIMRKSIQKKAKFNITDLNTIKGDKNIIKFEGDHNTPRPQFYFDSINIFFHNVLQPPEDEMGAALNRSIHDYFESVTSGTRDAIEQVCSKRPISLTEVPSCIPSRENKHGCEDKDAVADNGSSSSNMISFELSNGDPFCPHVPTIMENDQYVEYQLDDLTGFPCNVEEEEKMFMEAIIESLKDLEMQRSRTEKDETNSVSTSSTTEKYSSLSPESISTPVEHNQAPFETESMEHASRDTGVSTVEPTFEVPPSVPEPRSRETSARSGTSATTQSSAGVDISASTKATVTVVRSPSNNIMDGLMRRWDLNFFRCSR